MWNKPTAKQLEAIPPLYSTEDVPLKEKTVHMHFWIGACDWWAVEHSDGLFFGFVILNGDYEMAEWGYFSLEELSSVRAGFVEVDRDLHFEPVQAQQIPEICKAQGWNTQGRKEVMPI